MRKLQDGDGTACAPTSARMVILNMPLPESGHRSHDIILNDDASNGTRVDEHGREVPVFDELSIWEVSEYSTFRVRLQIPDEPAEEQLINLWIGLQALPQIRWPLPNSRRDARPLPVAQASVCATVNSESINPR